MNMETKFCNGECKAEVSLSSFKIPPSGKIPGRCHDCTNKYHAAYRERSGKRPRDLRRLKKELTTLIKCERCDEDKEERLFPVKTTDRKAAANICQECEDKRRKIWTEQVAAGDRQVGDRMAFHHPVIDGKKECRICHTSKHLETEFHRRNTPHGYYHECRDCRNGNARLYGQAHWNDILRARYQNDEQYRVRVDHRANLRRALRIAQKGSNKYIQESGCSAKFMLGWIESQFHVNMTWENYGHERDQWSIDHVVPLEFFDMRDEKQRLSAFNWVNIQPRFENSVKGTKIEINEILHNFDLAEVMEKHEVNNLDRIEDMKRMLDSVITMN